MELHLPELGRRGSLDGGTYNVVYPSGAEGSNGSKTPIFMFGDTNMRTKFSLPCREFVNKWSEAGPTHHMAAAVGHHIDTILKVAKIFNIECDVVCR